MFEFLVESFDRECTTGTVSNDKITPIALEILFLSFSTVLCLDRDKDALSFFSSSFFSRTTQIFRSILNRSSSA